MLVLLCLGVIPAVQAQTYDKLWKQVEQAEKKSILCEKKYENKNGRKQQYTF